MTNQISWSRLGRAVEHYASAGYLYIDVPWWVTAEVSGVTKPADATSYTLDRNGKVLVASGEQSFLYMLAKGHLTAGQKYQTVTPCFREENQDSIRRKHFMKCELFQAGTLFSLRPQLSDVIECAQKLFEHELDESVEVQETHTDSIASYDINYRGVELGSYGLRYANGYGSWLYGTGLAEPRFSSTIKPKAAPAAGYHLRPIKRGVLGELSKVAEELDEALEASEQGNPLMMLLELSDAVGAIEAVAEANGMPLEALLKMKDATQRAFKSGARK